MKLTEIWGGLKGTTKERLDPVWIWKSGKLPAQKAGGLYKTSTEQGTAVL
jgi:hypothetical protein